MKKIDIILALITGEAVAWLFVGIINDINFLAEIKGLDLALPIIFPILAVFGLWVAYLIGKKFLFAFQAAKFILIGVLATLVDLGVYKFLALVIDLDFDWSRNIYKASAFIVATFAKYWGNKFWAFEKMEKAGMGKELIKFYLVTAICLIVNVGIFSLIVNSIGSQFGVPPKTWETFGVIIAAFVVAVWNFTGYKFLVFKK